MNPRVRLVQLIARLDEWLAWPECPVCGRRHDPRDHYGLHDDTYLP